MKKTIAVILFLFSIVITRAQDVIFSQFYNTPHITNGAFTGLFGNKYRVGTNLKSQWYNIQNPGFNTISVFGDMRFSAFKNDYFSAGITLLNDNTGVGNLNYSYGQLSFSYFKNLHISRYSERTHYLLLGTQIGYGNRYFGKNNFLFGIQFDKDKQVYDPDIPNGENLLNSKSYLNMNLGLAYYFTDKRGSFYVGMNVAHVNSPDISLLQNVSYKLRPRFSGILGGDLNLNKGFALLPALFFNLQGAHKHFLLGSHLRYEYHERDNNAFRIGGWFRLSDSVDSFEVSGIVLSSVLEFNHLNIGLSYDFSTSSIRKIEHYNNSFELSVIYKWGEIPIRHVISCPRF